MTIADTLSDAVSEIDRYTTDDGPYADEITDKWIMSVRDSMERLRCFLDRDPEGNEPPFRSYDDVLSDLELAKDEDE